MGKKETLKTNTNIKVIKVEKTIYFSAGDIILALYKTKKANHKIDTLIDGLVSMEERATNELN